MSIVFVIYIAVFVLTLSGLGIYRRWSLRRGLLDLPNERSLHRNPTPRGGGIVICLVTLVFLGVYGVYFLDRIPWTYVAGAGFVIAISWIDDLRSISPLWRFICHTVAAVLIVAGTDSGWDIKIPFHGTYELGPAAKIAIVIWIVGLINAYNFMDGIDGLAGVQAVSAGIGWLLIGYWSGVEIIAFLGGVLAVSSTAFLFYNWQPAKIFLGDVGSAFLGFTFAAIPFLGMSDRETKENTVGPEFFPAIAVLLVWFFVFDFGFTLARRAGIVEKFWRPHRQHVYQQLVTSGYSHQSVALLYGAGSFLIAGAVLYACSSRGRDFDKITAAAASTATILLLVIWRLRVNRTDTSGVRINGE